MKGFSLALLYTHVETIGIGIMNGISRGLEVLVLFVMDGLPSGIFWLGVWGVGCYGVEFVLVCLT